VGEGTFGSKLLGSCDEGGLCDGSPLTDEEAGECTKNVLLSNRAMTIAIPKTMTAVVFLFFLFVRIPFLSVVVSMIVSCRKVP
jgi:hypothetical protein